eukprot:753038-Hanusia_phi.AAC.2
MNVTVARLIRLHLEELGQRLPVHPSSGEEGARVVALALIRLLRLLLRGGGGLRRAESVLVLRRGEGGGGRSHALLLLLLDQRLPRILGLGALVHEVGDDLFETGQQVCSPPRDSPDSSTAAACPCLPASICSPAICQADANVSDRMRKM